MLSSSVTEQPSHGQAQCCCHTIANPAEEADAKTNLLKHRRVDMVNISVWCKQGVVLKA